MAEAAAEEAGCRGRLAWTVISSASLRYYSDLQKFLESRFSFAEERDFGAQVCAR